ncbi:hypothetical protein [Deinococcus sp. LM3]|nr:hypothetical protein [Deinococcus sp. LM3]
MNVIFRFFLAEMSELRSPELTEMSELSDPELTEMSEQTLCD